MWEHLEFLTKKRKEKKQTKGKKKEKVRIKPLRRSSNSFFVDIVLQLMVTYVWRSFINKLYYEES